MSQRLDPSLLGPGSIYGRGGSLLQGRPGRSAAHERAYHHRMDIGGSGFADTIQLQFGGLRARIAPLNWSQLYMWDFLSQARPHDAEINIWVEVALPNGPGIGETLGVLKELIDFHEVMRTVYRANRAGPPDQEVRADGTLSIIIVDEDSQQAWAEGYRSTTFDESKPPIQIVIVRNGESVRRILLVGSHLALDGWSAQVLRRQLRERFAGRPWPDRDMVTQPIDQGRWELSAPGRAASQAGLERWRATIADVPIGHLAPIYQQASPRYWEVRWSSAAAGEAINSLSLKHRAVKSAILLSVYSRALGMAFGYRRMPLQIVTHNRLTPGLRNSVGCHFRQALMPLDTHSERADHRIGVAAATLLRTVRHAQANPRDISRMLLDHGRASYFDIAHSFFYNFMISESAGVSPSCYGESTIEWLPSTAFQGQPMYLNAKLAGRVLDVRLLVDTWCISRSAVEQVLADCLEDLVHRLPSC